MKPHPTLRRRTAAAALLALATALAMPLGATLTLLPGASLAQAPAKPGAKPAPTAPTTPAAPASSVATPTVVPNGAPPLANHHAAYTGEPFFLLSDATYGSGEVAKVRLEIASPELLEDSGGVDMLVYRVPDPLDFLGKQKNLHRVQLPARPTDQGLGNTLTHLWDNWVVKARLAWRQLFSSEARRSVTRQAPELGTPRGLTQPSTFEQPVQLRPLAGLPVVERFRYPVHRAKPIAPPRDLKLAGSSSEFIQPARGNVFVPLGQRQPGLYLVEAIAGRHRTLTLLFVADTVAVTKTSAAQMVVWTAQRSSGAPVAKSRLVWSDGLGVLKSGRTDDTGVLRLEHAAPEQSYVYGEDPGGGVFITENFYYDSEIHNTKVYAVTDRPLYRPGDWVSLKVTAREFRSARVSVPLKDAELQLAVFDPAGQQVHAQSLRYSATQGADARFALPDNAAGGGYEIRLGLRTGEADEVYSAAFRVAEYHKPHFEIVLQPDRADFRTGDPVTGKLQLNYPDGKPVAHAQVSLSARAQQLTMVEGELDYAGAFPLKLGVHELVTGADGSVRYSLPAASEPARYVLTALATDGAAWRVRVTRELLIERGSGSWRLLPTRQFSEPGEAVVFQLAASQRNNAAAGATADAGAAQAAEPARPARWEWLRLEDRSRAAGAVPAAGGQLAIEFPQPGSYTVRLLDGAGRLVGAASHWVSGAGVKAPAGNITIVLDQPAYRAGDVAQALVTFPEPVEHAWLTLERDRVEASALTGRRADWVASTRVTPTQWRVSLPVREDMSPNMTLSVAYVKGGDYAFQNQGVTVEQPRIAIELRTDKPVYAPGDLVTVDVATTLAGKPVAADVSVGVVDEMIYVLQPEIAPTINEFFHHPRRNNVRTSASLAFIGYDLATSALGALPARRQVNQRAVKLLERPRRDNVDTAAWQPRLATDASGRARFSFVMPDSLTRWRLTGRAVEPQGAVGQQTAWIRSDKSFYAKWTSPDWLREGDRAQAAIALFNQTGQPAQIEWEARSYEPGAAASAAPGQASAPAGAGRIERKETITAQPGVNHIQLALPPGAPGQLALTLTLRQGGKVVDSLVTPLQRRHLAWRAPRELLLDLSGGSAALNLPADASRVLLTLNADPAAGAFSRRMDELIDFPYGCVEQTASRLLPLAIALQSLGAAQQPLAPMLTQRLAGARLSLAQMAGPQAQFGWWGQGMAPDAFLTSYAYYADWRASLALRSPLPAEHWQRLLDVYAKDGTGLPPLQRALALGWMQEMGLPVAPMLAGLIEQLSAQPRQPDRAASAPNSPARRRGSLALADEDELDGRDPALVLAVYLAGQGSGNRQPPSLAARASADLAAARLARVDAPLLQALLLYTGRPVSLAGMSTSASAANSAAGGSTTSATSVMLGGTAGATALLPRVRADAPTFDRAQALVWLHKVLGKRPDGSADSTATAAAAALPAPGAPWQRVAGSLAGEPRWALAAGQPLPARIELPTGRPAAWAALSYDSREPQASTLPVRIERTLWRVVPQAAAAPAAREQRNGNGNGNNTGSGSDPGGPAGPPGSESPARPSAGRMTVALEKVAPGTPLVTGALYLDQVDITASRALRWALAEVPLPPGAAVESATWGLDLAGTRLALEAARHLPSDQGYALPLEQLTANGTATFRHLLRFSQRGSYSLPPARVYRMYEPEAKAYEARPAWAAIEVR
ncbi:MAG: hypothetical protein RLZZ584_423 [Pseudomonadota bacterium]